ncbi:MAG TPA: hypothetical protein VHP11_01650 [Tepidisphaeraceae bacterium]|nr:hypothetical protein [Tepidisphaeraceae bacterium]
MDESKNLPRRDWVRWYGASLMVVTTGLLVINWLRAGSPSWLLALLGLTGLLLFCHVQGGKVAFFLVGGVLMILTGMAVPAMFAVLLLLFMGGRLPELLSTLGMIVLAIGFMGYLGCGMVVLATEARRG